MTTSDEPIIIVDDDQDDQFLIKKVCENIGTNRNMLFFDDGREVLKYLRATTDNPFLILCDINMPVINGLELRREINKDEGLRTKCIPFVFFSTAASPVQIDEAYRLTVQGFFIKETSMQKLEKTLRLVFEYWELCKHPHGIK